MILHTGSSNPEEEAEQICYRVCSVVVAGKPAHYIKKSVLLYIFTVQSSDPTQPPNLKKVVFII